MPPFKLPDQVFDDELFAIESRARIPSGPLIPLLPPNPQTRPLPRIPNRSRDLPPFGRKHPEWICDTFYFPAAFPRVAGTSHHPPSFTTKQAASRVSETGQPPPRIDVVAALKELYTKGVDGLEVEIDLEKPSSFDDQEPLFVAANRYRREVGERKEEISVDKGLTLVCCHANGFHKELLEPMLSTILSSPETPPIHEIWSLDMVNSGDSGILNDDTLGDPFHWTDCGRDLLQFLLQYINSPSLSGTSPTIDALPLDPQPLSDPSLLQLDRPLLNSSELTNQPKTTDANGRTVVTIGHSIGGAFTASAAAAIPSLFSSIILIDPIVPPVEFVTSTRMLTGAALVRKSLWKTREAAREAFLSKAFFREWDPEVLEKHMEHGLLDTESGVRLKTRPIREAAGFGEPSTAGGRHAHSRLHLLPSTVSTHFLWGDHEHAALSELAIGEVMKKARYATSERVPGAAHLMVHTHPHETGRSIAKFLEKTYRHLRVAVPRVARSAPAFTILPVSYALFEDDLYKLESRAKVSTGPLLPILPPNQSYPTRPLPPLPFRSKQPPPFGVKHPEWTVDTYYFPAAFPRISGASKHPIKSSISSAANKVSEPGSGRIDVKEALRELYVKGVEGLEKVVDVNDPKTFEDQEPLFVAANRYRNRDSKIKVDEGLTLVCSHANGFIKEIFEPMLTALIESPDTPPIYEIWTLDCVNQGDSGLLNNGVVDAFHWSDSGRDVLQFVTQFLDSPTLSSSPSQLSSQLLAARHPSTPTLTYVDGKAVAPLPSNGRTLIALGHSFGGTYTSIAASTVPSLFSSLILIDPPLPLVRFVRSSRLAAGGAITRKGFWKSREEAKASFMSKAFFRVWDPRVLDIYVKYGLLDTENGVRLKTWPAQEAATFGEPVTVGGRYATSRLHLIPPSVSTHFLWADSDESVLPTSTTDELESYIQNVTSERVTGGSHLMVQTVPDETGKRISRFLFKKYGEHRVRL